MDGRYIPPMQEITEIDEGHKYFRVIRENFLWKLGAILEELDDGGYAPLNGIDIWDMTKFNDEEYISGEIVENSPLYFQRVYPIHENKTGTDKFATAQEADTTYRVQFTDKLIN